MTVLILTSEEDVTADMVINHLVKQGTPVMRVDPQDFPGRVDLTARSNAGGGVVGHLLTEFRSVDLADIRSIWLRRPGPPGHLATTQKEWVSLECERAFYGTLRAMDVPWMNCPDAVARSRYKIWQLLTAQSAGFKIPRTLVTTSPAVARQFSAGAGPLIVKSVSGRHPEEPPLTLPTVRVPHGADFSGVAASATCLQEEIDKRCDVRVTVVGEQVFACFIKSEENTLDWRFLPPEECSWTMGDLPDDVRLATFRYMEAAGLVYAAFDFAVDTDGAWWFLEANTGGQFGFVEISTGAPISLAIADWLTRPGPVGP
jgi:ATP-grasp ribosomal peptide maturase